MVERLDSRRFDAAVFAFALCLRLAFLALWQWKGLAEVYRPDLYYTLAQSWLGWIPPFSFDATHPPLYTGFIAAVLGVFRSSNPLSVLVVQCLLGAGSVVLLRRIAERLTDAKTARWAALWVAIDPALVFFTPQLQTETVFVAMELVFFAGLIKLLDEPLSWRLVLLGVWGGMCALCRSVFGAYPGILFFALWKTKGFVRAFSLCAVLGLGWFVPNIVWTARNYHKYGGFVPMSAQMGWTLYEGFSLDRDEVRRRPYEMADEAKAQGLSDPREEGRYFMAKTKAFVAANPLAALKIVVGKAFLYWRPFPYDPHTWWQRDALGVYYLIVFALGLLGILAVRGRPEWASVWALFVYLTMAHAVFFTSLRYRLPLEPFLCLLAAAGALKLGRERRGA